ALGAIIVGPMAAQAQSGREEGPREIEKCRTIDKPGSYRLVNNLTAGPHAHCLGITAGFVPIHLPRFTIPCRGSPVFPGGGGGDSSAAVLGASARRRRAERVDLKFFQGGRSWLG